MKHFETLLFQGNVYQQIGAVDVYRPVCSRTFFRRFAIVGYNSIRVNVSVRRLDCIAEREVQTS